MAKDTKWNTRSGKIGASAAKSAFRKYLLWYFGRHGKKRDNWKETFDYFKGRCAYCGKKVTVAELHKDHAIPANKTYHGTNQHGNFVPACRPCNIAKSGKHYEEYCKENKLTKEKKKIDEWMDKCGYKPLAKTKKIGDKITGILNKADADIDRLMEKYIKLIEQVK